MTERSALMSDPNDDLVAFLLISTWALATGRRLRSDVPPGELTERELIDFWSDDHLWPAARGTIDIRGASHNDSLSDRGNGS
jgi:hypothetical protein